MNISLTEHFNQYIEKKVKSGKYFSASEVVRSALRLMEERDSQLENETAYLREKINEGLDSGPSETFYAEQFLNTVSNGNGQFKVNSTIANNQQEPDVAIASSGAYAVVWSSYDQDGDLAGIYGQRYNKQVSKPSGNS